MTRLGSESILIFLKYKNILNILSLIIILDSNILDLITK